MSDIAYQDLEIHSSVRNEGLQVLQGGENGVSEGANTLYAKSFVAIVSGVLRSTVAVASGAAENDSSDVVYGYLNDASTTGSVVDPPYDMYMNASGQKLHWPVSAAGLRFAIWVTDATFHIGEADGAPALSEVSLGGEYELIVGGTSTPASGAYAGRYALNVDGTTDKMVRVVDIPRMWKGVDQSVVASTFNGIVIVEVLPAVLQTA